ncbi:putative high affinity nitrate transporter [Leucosporidium creatinivorum]|uniref:Nitrate/nitrite transporter n=1 Tax=Leucosporidium creatinivorum TaxID=106004 RepID=A0A1Y2FLA2_9BASI|nr:putative high affinity nitrate transporter [Leucosporidium creatinivorum]
MATFNGKTSSPSSASGIEEQMAPAGIRADKLAAVNLHAPPPFRWASLWEKPVINGLNGKSQTFPIFRFDNPYSRNFHFAWLGFFVAFLSWFAFPPLIPEAIKTDLSLTQAQIGNSNIVALSATMGLRLCLGPVVDRFGPRKVMAAILLIGAIPSGLAGTISSPAGLYTIRFFIGVLGATFVPCQAWTTAFFDKNIVGTANAFAGGWGNLGGGVTFVVQVSLFQSLVNRGLSSHSAWRAAFAIVPVPILVFVALLCIFLGTDCPAGKWEQRHTMPAAAIAMQQGHLVELDHDQQRVAQQKMSDKEQGKTEVQEVQDEDEHVANLHDIDVAVAEKPSWANTLKIARTPYTWLPALMYCTTFGFELAVDANLASVLFAAHKNLGQLNAGYYAATFGFMNVWTRPLGGIVGDLVGRRWGPAGKKYLTILLGTLQGFMSLALGLWQAHVYKTGGTPALGTQMGIVVVMAIFNEMANGANFSLTPHTSPYSNGLMTGLVGAFGNMGGVFFALIFRYCPANAFSQAWWISGIVAIVVNLFCIIIPAPKH